MAGVAIAIVLTVAGGKGFVVFGGGGGGVVSLSFAEALVLDEDELPRS
jgi:hypothetical protein